MKPIDQIEDAVQLLWRQSPAAWVEYLLATAPFLLALLAFAHDMTTGRAADRCLAESLLLACVFFWSAFWKARFAGTLLRSTGSDDSRPIRSRPRQCLLVAGTLETLKLIALPLAALSVVPFAWTSRFFRIAQIECDEPACTVARVVRRSAKLASSSSSGSWICLLILSIVGLVVFVNLLFTGVVLPSAVKIFTGYESDWTRNPHAALNFYLVSAIFAATWFVMAPLLEACAVVPYFYSEAQSDGRDLLLQLRRLAVSSTLLVLLVAAPLSAAQTRGGAGTSSTLSPADLTRALNQTLATPEFSRLAAPALRPHPPDDLAARLARDLNRLFTQLGSSLSSFGRWLRRLFREDSRSTPGDAPPGRSLPRLQIVLYALAALLALAILFAVVRARKRSFTQVVPASPAPPLPDLTSHDVLPTHLTDTAWLELARDYVSKGEPRLAIRAMYLSNLAYLGSRQALSLSSSKTNGIYERELRLRVGSIEAYRVFSSCNRDYEQAWYGLHALAPESTEAFESKVQALRHHV